MKYTAKSLFARGMNCSGWFKVYMTFFEKDLVDEEKYKIGRATEQVSTKCGTNVLGTEMPHEGQATPNSVRITKKKFPFS